MKQFPPRLPESSLPVPFASDAEKFFNLNKRPPTLTSKNQNPITIKWHTPNRKAGNSIVLFIQGLNETALDTFLQFLSSKFTLPPPVSSLEDMLMEITDSITPENAAAPQTDSKHNRNSEKAAPVETPATGEAATMGDNGQPSKTYKHRIRKWMLDDINRIIETNLDNDNFKACDLAKGLNYCTMQVHRIVKELTNLPTAYYIRRYRLLKSQGYLSNGKYNVSEVAYMVGFKSPEHFARCFRDEFGECPSNYRHRMSASGI